MEILLQTKKIKMMIMILKMRKKKMKTRKMMIGQKIKMVIISIQKIKNMMNQVKILKEKNLLKNEQWGNQILRIQIKCFQEVQE